MSLIFPPLKRMTSGNANNFALFNAGVSAIRVCAYPFAIVPDHPPKALSQEVTAAFNGSVVDESGASVGARLTAIDTDRGTTYQVQTNGVGDFSLARLPVGTYDLKVEAPGFQTAVYRSVTLVLNQTARLDVQLKVGQAWESIDVSSVVPLLQTDSDAAKHGPRFRFEYQFALAFAQLHSIDLACSRQCAP